MSDLKTAQPVMGFILLSSNLSRANDSNNNIVNAIVDNDAVARSQKDLVPILQGEDARLTGEKGVSDTEVLGYEQEAQENEVVATKDVKDASNIPHQLKPIPVSRGQQSELTEASIQLYMTLLLHAATCSSSKCPSANCTKMKGLLKHGAQCQVKATGGCLVCKRIWALLQLHARHCKAATCPVPNCVAIRERSRQLKKQQHNLVLLHAATCSSPKCSSANCTKMKGLLKHGAQCQVKATGGCDVCKRIWALLQLHARHCKAATCPVPNCVAIRERFRQLEKQQHKSTSLVLSNGSVQGTSVTTGKIVASLSRDDVPADNEQAVAPTAENEASEDDHKQAAANAGEGSSEKIKESNSGDKEPALRDEQDAPVYEKIDDSVAPQSELLLASIERMDEDSSVLFIQPNDNGVFQGIQVQEEDGTILFVLASAFEDSDPALLLELGQLGISSASTQHGPSRDAMLGLPSTLKAAGLSIRYSDSVMYVVTIGKPFIVKIWSDFPDFFDGQLQEWLHSGRLNIVRPGPFPADSDVSQEKEESTSVANMVSVKTDLLKDGSVELLHPSDPQALVILSSRGEKRVDLHRLFTNDDFKAYVRDKSMEANSHATAPAYSFSNSIHTTPLNDGSVAFSRPDENVLVILRSHSANHSLYDLIESGVVEAHVPTKAKMQVKSEVKEMGFNDGSKEDAVHDKPTLCDVQQNDSKKDHKQIEKQRQEGHKQVRLRQQEERELRDEQEAEHIRAQELLRQEQDSKRLVRRQDYLFHQETDAAWNRHERRQEEHKNAATAARLRRQLATEQDAAAAVAYPKSRSLQQRTDSHTMMVFEDPHKVLFSLHTNGLAKFDQMPQIHVESVPCSHERTQNLSSSPLNAAGDDYQVHRVDDSQVAIGLNSQASSSSLYFLAFKEEYGKSSLWELFSNETIVIEV